MTAYCQICGHFLFFIKMMTSNEEIRELMIRLCKLEIRRLNVQLLLTYSTEEKSKIELQIKQEKEELRQYEMEQDF